MIIPATSPSAAARRPGSCRCESFDFFSRHGPGLPFPLPRHELLSAAVPKFVSIAETSRASSSSRPAATKASSSVLCGDAAAAAAAAQASVIPPIAQCCLRPPPWTA